MGGLGVIDLHKHGIALRLRWEWLRRTDPSRPWQGLSLVADKSVAQVFSSLVKWRVGDGDKTLFWKDRWIQGATIAEVAPLVAKSVRTQVANRRRVREALDMHSWMNDVVGDLYTEGLTQFIGLWEILEEVHLDEQSEDSPIWAWNASGTYTASSAYKMLCEGGVRFHSFGAIWKCWAPLACKIFMWLAVQYRLWTSDRRVRHNLQDQISQCFLCDQEEDTVDHILLQCVFSRQVWFTCILRMGLPTELCPTYDSGLAHWWSDTRKRFLKHARKEFDSFVMLICWTLWKQRNARVFGSGQIKSEQGTVDTIFDELRMWATAGAFGEQCMLE